MTINFNFHYQEIGRKFPDANEKCQQTYIGVYNYLKGIVEENKIIVGGKSMGGRIATHIAPKINNRKIIVMGYPLHPPGKPNNLRDEHLYSITQKVLIIQGENDTFGNKAELDPVIEKMKDAHVLYIPFGNHSLKASKKSLLNNNDLEKKTLDYIVKFINRSL